MNVSRKFFKSKYLNKKHSVNPVFLITIFFCCVITILLQVLVLIKSRELPVPGLSAGTLLIAVILLIVTSLTFRKSSEAAHLSVDSPASHDQSELTNDLQNENKYFSKVLSHDLRSPLSSIVLLASYLKTKNENSENNRYIELIEQSARKELDMMAILLSLMRSDSFKSENLQELELKSVVEVLLVEYESQIGQKQIIPSIIIPADLRLETDPDSFTLVLKTLIHYALHYSDAGETLEIRTVETHAQTEIVMSFNSSQLKMDDPEELFRSENLLKNGVKAFPESVDLYFCRKLISSYNGTVHVQATEQTSACRFILTLERRESESTAI